MSPIRAAVPSSIHTALSAAFADGAPVSCEFDSHALIASVTNVMKASIPVEAGPRRLRSRHDLESARPRSGLPPHEGSPCDPTRLALAPSPTRVVGRDRCRLRGTRGAWSEQVGRCSRSRRPHLRRPRLAQELGGPRPGRACVTGARHDRKLERRDSGVYFQPFSNPRGTTRESPYRLYGRSSRG